MSDTIPQETVHPEQEKEATAPVDSWEEKMVELSLLDRSPFQVRSSLEGSEALAESIRTLGLLTPILARPVNGRVQVIGGARRWKAVELLKRVLGRNTRPG